MPLPAALLARLSKRGIVTAESEAKRRRQEEEEQKQKEPEEEIIAEGMERKAVWKIMNLYLLTLGYEFRTIILSFHYKVEEEIHTK